MSNPPSKDEGPSVEATIFFTILGATIGGAAGAGGGGIAMVFTGIVGGMFGWFSGIHGSNSGDM